MRTRRIVNETRTRKEEKSNSGTKNEPEIVTISSSTSEEEEMEAKSVNKAKEEEEQNDGDEQKEEKEEMNKKKKKKKKKSSENEMVSYCFPMHRIQRIIRSEGSDLRITQEAIFLINKASEKFLELFCDDAYACSVQDHKNYVGYKHLSSVVCKRRRFDFLSDFVPEKLKAEDALAERTSAGTWPGGEDNLNTCFI